MKRRLRDQSGFTLVEMLVALALASVFAGSLFFTMRALLRGYGQENVRVALQQNVRAGVNLIAMDLRMAGLDPLGTDRFGFETATATEVRFTQDNDLDGNVDDSGFERITYAYDGVTGQVTQRLYEGTTVQQQALVMDDVTAFSLTFQDESGNAIAFPIAATDLDTIRGVTVQVTVEERSVTNPSENVERTAQSHVACRNQ